MPTAPNKRSWWEAETCDSCYLDNQGGSILCLKDSLYFLYAQVAFQKHTDQSPRGRKSVLLIRNPDDASLKVLAEGTFPPTTEGSVWVAKVVRLRTGDRVGINITGDILSDITVWGAYELH